MDHKPEIGTRVKSERGVVGTVVGYPKKEKHKGKVCVLKDDSDGKPMTGCNAQVMVKFQHLSYIKE